MVQHPRLPTASTEASADRLRAIRDFHFGATPSGPAPVGWWPAALPSAPAEGGGEPAGPDLPLRELLEAARTSVPSRRLALRGQVEVLRDALAELLAVEDQKDPGADRLRSSVGSFGGELVDPSALARVLGPQRGSKRVDIRRRQRIERVLENFDRFLGTAAPPLLTVLHEPATAAAIPVDRDLVAVEVDDACRGATEHFDREAAQLCELIRAVRTARLELDTAYDEARHDLWMQSLDWESLQADELALVPLAVAVGRADRFGAEGMPALSQLLASGRPVQIVALVPPVRDPERSVDELFSSWHLELGFLGIAHREAFVQQASAAFPEHLREGLGLALAGNRTALHVVSQDPSDGAVQSRAHPLFRYDPGAGGTWARRLDFAGNPESAADWVGRQLTCASGPGRTAVLDLRVTFADHALLDPALSAEAMLLADDLHSDELVLLADFLDLEAGDAARRIPFVWVVDADGDLHRLVLRRRLVHASRDRLAFWRSLQELAGVHNEHVEQAVERAREAAERGREELETQRAAELEQIRSEALGQAAQLLANSLVGLGAEDLTGLAVAPPRPAIQAAPATGAVATAEPAVEEATAGTAAPSSEPWIETVLCTSCNDCRNINPQLFVYDENKQAKIGDPGAGSFAQLVKAAEKCPARCIHPGQPSNPDEPGLEKLLKRAAVFQ